MRKLPPALVPVAIRAERRRRAIQRYQAFEDALYSDHSKMAVEYIPGRNEPQNDGAGHYVLTPMIEHREALRRDAFPEFYTPEQVRERQIAQSEAQWSALDRLMGGGVTVGG